MDNEPKPEAKTTDPKPDEVTDTAEKTDSTDTVGEEHVVAEENFTEELATDTEEITPSKYDLGKTITKSEPVKSHKLSVKQSVLLVVLLVLLAAGYVAFVAGDRNLVKQPSTDTNSGEVVVEPTETKFLNFLDGNKMFQVDSAGLVTDQEKTFGIAAADTDESRSAVYNQSGTKYAYYEEVFGSERKVVTSSEAYITIKTVDSSEPAERITEAIDSDGNNVYIPVKWKDNNTLLARRFTCSQCDAPPNHNLYSVDVTTGKISNTFDNNTYGFLSVSPENSGVAFVEMHLSFDVIYSEYSAFKSSLYYYDLSSNSLKTVKTISGVDQYFDGVVGWSQDNRSVIATVNGFKKLTDNKDEVGSSDSSINFDHISIINIDSGKETKIPLELSDLAADQLYPKGSIIDAAIYNDQLYFVIQTYADSTYSLRSIPLTGEKAAVTRAHSSKDIITIGSIETVVESN